MEIKPPFVVLAIRTKLPTHDSKFANRFLDLTWRREPKFRPDRYGFDEEEVFPYEENEEFFARWSDLRTYSYGDRQFRALTGLLWWRKQNLKLWGWIDHTEESLSGSLNCGSIGLHIQFDPAIDWRSFFHNLCQLTQPQLAMMHLFNPKEAKKEGRASSFALGSFNAVWEPKVPGFGWMFAAGHEFYDRTMAVPLDETGIDRQDFGGYCTLQIARDADEILNNFPAFEARRTALMERLPIVVPDEE